MSAGTVTSPFLPDALAAMGAGRLVLIDGAVDDDVLLEGQRISAAAALARTWEQAADALIVHWRPAGLAPARMEDRARLEQLLAVPGDVGAVIGESALDRHDPLDVLALAARLFGQEDERIALLVEDADLLLASGSDPYSRRVAAAAVQAVAAFEDAEELHALVMLTRDLGALSAALARRPGSARLRIPAPGLEARTAVAAQAFGTGAREVERLAVTADGLALREIAMLPAHARATGLGPDRPGDLVTSFRHGHRVDPWAALTPERMAEVRAGITAHVFGQDRALAEALERLDVARSRLELDPPTTGTRKPRLELFLVGPTGVGKNELARALARELFGDPGAVMVFDMGAFQQEHSGEQLFGAPPGYVGHERGSPLVDRLRERPFSVIVFDEIEKAHHNNWLRLMAAVDEGRVTDTRGITASMEDAIVIFTSNIGGDVLLDRAAAHDLSTEAVEELTQALVQRHLCESRYSHLGHDRQGLGKPEVWGRMQGSLVAFDLLRAGAADRIVHRFCCTLAASATSAADCPVEIDSASVAAVIKQLLGRPGTWNGRLIRGHVDRLVRRPLARLLADPPRGTGTLHVRLDGEGQLVARRG
jgi:hypothetical protein